MSGRHLLGPLGSSWVELARLVPTGPLPAGAYSRTGAVVVGATIWTSLLEPGESTYHHEYVHQPIRGHPSKQFKLRSYVL